MRPFRFSIASLLFIIVLLGFAFAALRAPSQLWVNTWFSAALAVVVAAVLLAVYRRGRKRTFWVGFATCGGVYFLVAFCPMFEPMLITTAALDLLAPQIEPALPPPPAASTAMSGMMSAMMAMPGSNPLPIVPPQPPPQSTWAVWTDPEQSPRGSTSAGGVRLESSEAFREVGHSVFTLLFGFLGGILTARLASQRADSA